MQSPITLTSSCRLLTQIFPQVHSAMSHVTVRKMPTEKHSAILKPFLLLFVVLYIEGSYSSALSSLGNLQKSLGTTSNTLLDTKSGAGRSLGSMSSAADTTKKDNNITNLPSAFVNGLNLKRRKGQPKDYDKVKASDNQNPSDSQIAGVEEVECIQTMFMSPFHFPVEFSLNETIYRRNDKKCRWNFIGTEPCIPKLTCDTSQMSGCSNEYMEIVDGFKGYRKVCSGDLVEDLTASGDLRDLYIHYKVIKRPSGEQSTRTLLNCTVTCSERNDKVDKLQDNFKPKVNPKCYCGTKPNDDRIVNGETAKKFEFPWLVALVETNTRQPFCGGSIVNDKFIMTAGHCIKGKFVDYTNIQIVVNGHEFDISPNTNILRDLTKPKTYPPEELKKMDKGNGSSRHNLDEILVHPLYVSENNDFDIALLKVQRPLNLTPRPAQNGVPVLQQPRAICLPPMGSYLRTYSNKKAIIAGWGLPDIDAVGTPQVLQKLDVNVFSPQACKDFFAHRVNRRMLCAGHKEGGKDSCSGDSGGPLILEDKPKVWTQIGSVSWGEGCGEEGHPGVYFRTTEGLQWINYMTNYYQGEEENDKGATWCIFP